MGIDMIEIVVNQPKIQERTPNICILQKKVKKMVKKRVRKQDIKQSRVTKRLMLESKSTYKDV